MMKQLWIPLPRRLFFLILILFSNNQLIGSIKYRIQNNSLKKQNHRLKIRKSYRTINIRGGASTDSDDDEKEINVESEEIDELSSDTSSPIIKVLTLLGKGTIITVKTVGRCVKAAFAEILEDSDNDEEESSIMKKMTKILQSMWKAALNPPEDDENNTASARAKNKNLSRQAELMDFGQFLSMQYNVDDDRIEESKKMLGGAVGDALTMARSEARLLVAYIPASRPSNKKKSSSDHIAIRSLLSSEVSKIGERKSRKKSKTETGSFLFWGAKAGSPDAVIATKRLKAKQPKKGDKRPILVVAYPARVIGNSGIPKIVPRLLAQHHCSPPPSAEMMAEWLNALRKRHKKEFASMIHDIEEVRYLQERISGYKDSVKSDKERKEKEKKEKEERLRLEKLEKERLEKIEARRIELKESLPEEPEKTAEGVITIALRFSDGRAGQRRFESSTEFVTIFNWVDAMYDMEREKITLTTMNGQQSFEWNDSNKNTTLKEAKLGRMTGLRVFEKKDDDSADTSEKDE